MDKETTPQTYAAWKASIDDTGCVCRMEPIWETMTRLEIGLSSLRRRLEMAVDVCNDRIKETEATGDLEWTERNKHVARILVGILEPNTRLAKERLEKVLEALRSGPLTTPDLKAAIGTKSDLAITHLLTYNDLLRESGSKERLVAKQESSRSKKFLWSIRTITPKETAS